MFSNQSIEKFDDREPEVLLPTVPATNNLHAKSATLTQRKPFASNPIPIVMALGAMLHRFHTDPTFIAYGEENRDWACSSATAINRIYSLSSPLQLPDSEAAAGTARGYAMSGGRVCAELMHATLWPSR